MKNILILSTGKGIVFESIIKYFKNRKDINFVLLCNNFYAEVIKKAKKYNIETVLLEKTELKKYFKSSKFDLVIVSEFNLILDEEIVKTGNFINLHSSLLPKYSCFNPAKRAYINKDLKTGITVHQVNKELCKGKIIFQKEFSLNQKWDLKKFEKEINKIETYFYPRVIEKLLGLNVLVVGSNASDHIIAEKITESKILNKLYLADCNDGFSNLGEKINYEEIDDLAYVAQQKNINFVVVNSKKYLDKNFINLFEKKGIQVLGLDKTNSKVLNSKIYAKKIMQKYGIKTPLFKKINNKNKTEKYLAYFKNPIIKTNGYSDGKGVYFDENIEKLKRELYKYLDGKYDKASKTSLIEEKIFGSEVSLFSLWDGETLIHLPLCKNYRKNNDGLYTSGLGSKCPIVLKDNDYENLNKYKIILLNLFKKEKIKNPLILQSDLIVAKDDIYVNEFNLSLDDSQTQSLMNYIENDWLEIFYSIKNKMLENLELDFANNQITTIQMLSKGYPLRTRNNIEINNLENVQKLFDNIKIYFSDIYKKDGKILTNGGRILSISSKDKNTIYRALGHIEFEEKMFRDDI